MEIEKTKKKWKIEDSIQGLKRKGEKGKDKR